jgi:uncharacterized protein YkwD
MPARGNLNLIRAATLCLINKQRAANGEAPLHADGRLQAAAQGHSNDMVAGDYFDHTSPSGRTFLARIVAAGYSGWHSLGENIATGTGSYATPAATVDEWMHSPGHRANILDRAFHASGIGVAPAAPPSFAGGAPGGTYTQDFGG